MMMEFSFGTWLLLCTCAVYGVLTGTEKLGARLSRFRLARRLRATDAQRRHGLRLLTDADSRRALMLLTDLSLKIDELPPLKALAMIGAVEMVMKDSRADAVDRIPAEDFR